MDGRMNGWVDGWMGRPASSIQSSIHPSIRPVSLVRGVLAAAVLLAMTGAAPAGVGISGDASTIVLSNDLVRLSFDRRGGNLASWTLVGRVLLGRGGG